MATAWRPQTGAWGGTRSLVWRPTGGAHKPKGDGKTDEGGRNAEWEGGDSGRNRRRAELKERLWLRAEESPQLWMMLGQQQQQIITLQQAIGQQQQELKRQELLVGSLQWRVKALEEVGSKAFLQKPQWEHQNSQLSEGKLTSHWTCHHSCLTHVLFSDLGKSH